MDSFIIQYIAQQMSHLGYSKFTFEPILVIVPGDQTSYSIDGVNEFYYLVSKVLAPGIEIEADNTWFKADESYASLDYFRYQEFTGQIRITFPAGVNQPLEFIRALPH